MNCTLKKIFNMYTYIMNTAAVFMITVALIGSFVIFALLLTPHVHRGNLNYRSLIGRHSFRSKDSSCVPKILVLIITSDANARWQNEYKFYLDRISRNNFMNITFKFVQCSTAAEGPIHLNMQCSESFIPGILQKSVLAIKKELKHFDFFVRTNLSTYIDCERLQNMIAEYQFHEGPLYTGGLLFDWGISGTSIVMNQKAADVLVSAYSKIKDKNVPDDVVIGEILKCHLHYTTEFEIMYWNFDLSIFDNFRQFSLKKTPFMRLRPPDDRIEMQPIYDAILNLT